ncbi:C45 family peptidase [Sporosarcina sp. ACRSL]|uniref:C45 family autoproteolytic acyltransferase/hydolase n=1 Tax=Sporosarcina sp. ACRSL TaxID=2918215 RepID=UPI001EF45C64|nr:C45 family peptidase [Sporosarcina sp. ACRSL]MCG7343392.1 C45 family peptidase [Sporosarcina sp. ACRSL]
MNGEQLVVRVVDLVGDAYQIGVAQGEEILSTGLAAQLELLRVMTRNVDAEKAKGILQDVSPSLLQELHGMADAMKMDLDTVIRIYSGFDYPFPDMGCTALAQNGYYVRNYDFSPNLYDARLVFAKPTDGYCNVGLSQQMIGRLDGMNEKGLVVGLHFVNSEHRGEGFIATTVVRMLLEQCANVEEATKLIAEIPHGYCYNYSMMDSSGATVVVEASPEQQVIKQMNPLVCANHFETGELKGLNRATAENSIRRQHYVGRLIDEKMSALSAYHHFNDGDSPVFFHHYEEYFGTLHTVVYSPEDLGLIFGVGENCEPMHFSIEDFMDGTAKLPESIRGIIKQG